MQFSKEKYNTIKVEAIRGRYITNQTLEAFISKNLKDHHLAIPGKSVQNKPIYEVCLGQGPVKILIWSQMHGNESTTTKAVLDMINFFVGNNSIAEELSAKCTLKIVPILNPDGAAAYTRVNANQMDLNRDASNLSQPESGFLRKLFDTFQPHFCFNLHDQRTIYNVGNTERPATVSFLAPASDIERNISASRKMSMQLIVAIWKMLQTKIPGQTGRYDDAFNPNCVGDTFQMRKTPTVLFEAGHYPGDYEREKTREYIFYALLKAIRCIAFDKIKEESAEDYFLIPENNKMFFDVLVTNLQSLHQKYPKGRSAGILYKETLRDGSIVFEPQIEATGELTSHFGHTVFDCSNQSDIEKIKRNSLLHQLLF